MTLHNQIIELGIIPQSTELNHNIFTPAYKKNIYKNRIL